MNISVPSLTTLSAQNEGNFPFLEVFMTVDGRTQVEGHGAPMPSGEKDSQPRPQTILIGPYGSELIVRGRILSLATYLEAIQEQPSQSNRFHFRVGATAAVRDWRGSRS